MGNVLMSGGDVCELACNVVAPGIGGPLWEILDPPLISVPERVCYPPPQTGPRSCGIFKAQEAYHPRLSSTPRTRSSVLAVWGAGGTPLPSQDL